MTEEDLVAKTPLEPFNEIGAAYNCLKALLWLVHQMETPGRHILLEHILAIGETLQDIEREGGKVSEGKKGREKPVKLGFLYRTREPIATNLQCPVCEQKILVRPDQVDVHFACLCGASLRVVVELTLEELEEEDDKGE